MGQRSKRERSFGLFAYVAILLGGCAGLLTGFIFHVVLDVHGELVVLISLLVMVSVGILIAKIGRHAVDRSEATKK